MHLFLTRSFIVLSLISLGPVRTAEKQAEGEFGSRNLRSTDDEYVEDLGIDECRSSGNCVPICCPPGLYISGTSCIENADAPASELEFPQVYTEDLDPVNYTDDSGFRFAKFYPGPCASGSYALNPEYNLEDEFYLIENGQIYLPNYLNGTILDLDGYCFASVSGENQSVTVIAVCFPDYSNPGDSMPVVYPIAMLLSTPFLIATFAVYAVIPEFANIHGLTLRAYVGVLFVAYIALVIVQLGDQKIIEYVYFCTALVRNSSGSFLHLDSYSVPIPVDDRFTEVEAAPVNVVSIMQFVDYVVVIIACAVILVRCSETPSPCPRALSVPLTKAQRFENGSLFFKDRLFPQELIWSNDEATFGCPCGLEDIACVRICCKPGELLRGSKCVKSNESVPKPVRPLDKNLAPDIRWIKKLEDKFYTIPNRICPTESRYSLDPKEYPVDEYVLHSNGTLTTEGETFQQEQYCVGSSIDNETFLVIVCFGSKGKFKPLPGSDVYPIGMIASIPFLLATAIVYAIIPELRNLYGKSLMCYLGTLINGYTFLTVPYFDTAGDMPTVICTLIAFTIHFSFLASFFWLNVMCFDIWWTFGGFRSLQGSIKQRERKKFLMYSIYAWGCAILLTAVCVIMDFVPGIPEDILRPEFGVERCWFKSEEAKALYFYGPMGVTVFCNIILFISTAAKIIRHKKDTAHHLKGTDSKRHDDNKQWFNLYLKLFIVMGINWSMEIISWLWQGPKYLWYLTDIANTLQGVIIFIIFVWKDKIKRLLIKRFNCKGPNFLSRDSTRSAYHSSTSRTCTTSIPLHEKTNSVPDPVSRIKTASDDSDGV